MMAQWTGTLPLRGKKAPLDLVVEGNAIPAFSAQGTDNYWYAWVERDGQMTVWAWGKTAEQAVRELAERLLGR